MKICVFASANDVPPVYIRSAEELGFYLGQRGHSLVYGGYADGLMAAVADGFCRAGAPIIGIGISQFDGDRKPHPGQTETITARDLNERKRLMMDLADMYIVLPGGVGTLDEVFSVLSVKSIGGTRADVVFYDTEGFWEPLFEMLAGMREKGFIRDDMNGAYRSAARPEEALGE